MGLLRSTYYDAPPVKADDTEPSVSAVSIGRLSKSAPCLAERPHASCDARLDWGASHSLAAQSGKVSERQTLRNEGKFGPHFKGQFWKRHLRVRILPPQPASAVSAYAVSGCARTADVPGESPA